MRRTPASSLPSSKARPGAAGDGNADRAAEALAPRGAGEPERVSGARGTDTATGSATPADSPTATATGSDSRTGSGSRNGTRNGTHDARSRHPAPPRTRPNLACILAAVVLALAFLVAGPRRTEAAPPELADDGRVGVVADMQGTALVRPAGRQRWSPVGPRSVLLPGDEVRTLARGAHAAEIRLADGGTLVLGPDTQALLDARGSVRILRGEAEVAPAAGKTVAVTGPGKFESPVTNTTVVRADGTTTAVLGAAPRWLTGYRSSTTDEWMGSLLAKVDGRNVPLSVGYHKVGVAIRDQIAETTVEESFVNATSGTLEGVFTFPLPAGASISGFGMWIGDELVEADIVERDRARQIYEDIKARKKDPGLLEWSGGNLFTANVFPILPHAEKRIRLRYTQVLPLEGTTMRYRYALRSELLRVNPVRELEIRVTAQSATPFRSASSPTHEVRATTSGTTAVCEFRASQFTPDRDFEVVFGLEAANPLRVVAHRRGEDGYLMALLAPPDPSAGAWQRELVPEGRPLDLLFMADTSGSMGPPERKAQRAFLEAALALLGPDDRFRVMACDARVVWLDEAPLAATTENVGRALAFLDRRFSLGWSDLDGAFAAAAAHAKDGTLVVYIGDGVSTTGDADPVASAQRISRMQAPAGAAFHAVAPGSSYEQPVMEAIAARGGSFRATGDDPARAAYALLAEVAQPPMKDVRVSFDGIRTARVYPEKLPNVAAGTQQIVLGRYLPEGGGTQTGRVTVTGTLDGKAVRYTADLVVEPGAEGTGNTFLPRLWARRHLDALLAEGRTPAIKDEIVSMSERFGILTPYTSLLVLESDEDRERYGVARRVAMRDGERFFTEARTAAATAALRDGMQKARSWRLALRSRMLAEIAALGRGIALAETNEFVSYAANRTIAIGGGAGGAFGGPTTGGGQRLMERMRAGEEQGDGFVEFATRDEPVMKDAKFEDHNESEQSAGEPRFDSDAPFEKVPPDSREPGSPPAPGGAEAAREAGAPATPGADWDAEFDTATYDDAGGGDTGIDFVRLESAEKSLAAAKSPESGPLPAAASAIFGLPRGGSGPARASKPGGLGNAWMAQILFHQFPGVPVPADPPKAHANTWDAEIAALLASVSTRAPVTLAADARIETTWSSGAPETDDAFWPMSTGRALVSPEKWVSEQRNAGVEPSLQWLHGERGALATGSRLGRKRPGTERDRADWVNQVAPTVYDFVRSYSYAKWSAKIESRVGAQVVVALTSPGDGKGRMVFTLDTEKRAVVRWESWFDGKLSNTAISADFVRAGGIWWPTLETHTDATGRVTWKKTRTVREIDAADFDAALAQALAGQDDVIFLAASDPTPAAAKQAVHEARATFADLLVVASVHAGFQRWDEAWAAWEKARPLVDSPAKRRPGADWLELALATVGRRGETTATKARMLAESAAARGGPAAYGLAKKVESFAQNVLAPDERLTLLDVLEKAGDAASSDAEKRWQRDQWRQVRALVLQQAGRNAEATDLRRALWTEAPKNLIRAEALMSDLTNGGDADGAVALLDALEFVPSPMNEHLIQNLFAMTIRALGNAGRFEPVIGIAARWAQVQPERSEPYAAHLCALLAQDRIEDFDAWIRREVEAQTLPGTDRAALARLTAAVDLGIGVDWNPHWNENWWNSVADPVWIRPLAVLARRLSREPGGDIALAGRLVQNARWHRTDGHREFLQWLREDLVAPQGVETPKAADLVTILGWLAWDRESVDSATWRGIADRVKARWRAAKPDEDRAALLGAVLQLLDTHLEPDEAFAVLREELAAAPAERVPHVANLLLGRLARGPWTPALEDECLALVRRLVLDTSPVAEQRTTFASAARWIESRMTRLRTEAGLPPVVEREKLPRAELRLRQNKARADARRGLAARFLTEEKTAPALLRPWLTIERLCLLATLGDDPKSVEGEARELLLSAPARIGSAPGDPAVLESEQNDYLSDVRRERCVLVLSHLALRRGAPEGLADRVLALLRERLEKEPDTLDWRYATFRLLVALDRPAELEAALRAWIVPSEVESRWRRALGYLLAETGRVREATGEFEEIAKLDELSEPEWTTLADWYLVLGDDARREVALDRQYEKTDEWTLQNRIYREQGRLRQHGEGVPATMDDEVLRIIRAYLTKATYPGNALWPIRNLYEATKDFRVLAALADGVTGHSPEALYTFLQQVAQIVGIIHEEATCDAIRERIEQRIATARTDTDRRGLSLLLAIVERRASEVLDQKGPHAARALEHLRAARRGTWLPGERRLMAEYLAALGKIPDAAFAAEQVAQLRDLHAQETPGTRDRVIVAAALWRTEWAYDRHDAAIDGLTTALDERRQATGGRLPMDVTDHADTLIQWMEQRGRFAAAETWLDAEVARQTHRATRLWFERRIFRTWIAALDAGGTVSLGTGEALYRAAREKIGSAAFTFGPESADEVLGAFCDLHRTAHRRKVASTVAADLVASSKGLLVEVTSAYRRRATEHTRIFAEAVREVAGALPALTVFVERMEREPAWYQRRSRSHASWDTFAWSMGKWRKEAGALGEIEPRLLVIVLRELERDLMSEQSSNRRMYGRNEHFWSEKAGDFAVVARRVIETNPDSPGRLRHAAVYLWGDLQLKDEAIRTLEAADTRGRLEEHGRHILVGWLQELKRWKEMLPHAERLVADVPDKLIYRLYRIRALHFTGRDADGRAGVEAARAHFADLRTRRRVGVFHAPLADVAVECGWGDLAVTLYPDAISERRRASGGRGDGELSRLYTGLARALSQLGRHDEAIESASNAVVIWGPSDANRAQALGVVREVLSKVPDLAAWTTRWEADIAATGLDAPVLRLALADIHLERKEADAALRHLVAARRLTPDDTEVHARIVRAYELKQDRAGVAEALATSLQTLPKQPDLYAKLAAAYMALELPDEAERAVTGLAEFAPNEPDGHRRLAAIRAKAARHDDAVVQWRQVVRTRPREVAGWADLARALARAGKVSEAQGVVDEVLGTPWGRENRAVLDAVRKEVEGK